MTVTERQAQGLSVRGPERISIEALAGRLEGHIANSGRLGLLSARRLPDTGELALVALALDPAARAIHVWEAPLRKDQDSFPSLTPRTPQAHWFERAIYDMYRLVADGHPRFKSLLLHEAWPQGFHPLRNKQPRLDASTPARDDYRFLEVQGEGIYEIPVGPIHAGIIEPGHFRFSCLGEIIENLEIRLGYQHRGVEHQMTTVPWQRARFLAEAASSDTAVGNAWAHAMAIEQLLGIEPPPAAQALRALALEFERVASHIGDLGGICNDIGFAAGSATFARLRGRALGLCERLTGTRFATAYVLPGGVARPVPADVRADLMAEMQAVAAEFERAAPMLTDNAGALERMEGTGKVRKSLAEDFGLVGPAGRASGVAYDVREAFAQAPYAALDWRVAVGDVGDVLNRVLVRVEEVAASLAMAAALLGEGVDQGGYRSPVPASLPPDAVGIGIVEAWRGELIHAIWTDSEGQIGRYCIKDPSFNNWTGLAIAARGEMVPDFPLCNKSFSLSYSGNDL